MQIKTGEDTISSLGTLFPLAAADLLCVWGGGAETVSSELVETDGFLKNMDSARDYALTLGFSSSASFLLFSYRKL